MMFPNVYLKNGFIWQCPEPTEEDIKEGRYEPFDPNAWKKWYEEHWTKFTRENPELSGQERGEEDWA